MFQVLPYLKHCPKKKKKNGQSRRFDVFFSKRNHFARGNQFPLTSSPSRRQKGISMSRIDSFTILR